MNKEDIEKLISNGFEVPSYFKEDKYVFLEPSSIEGLFLKAVKLHEHLWCPF